MAQLSDRISVWCDGVGVRHSAHPAESDGSALVWIAIPAMGFLGPRRFLALESPGNCSQIETAGISPGPLSKKAAIYALAVDRAFNRAFRRLL